MAPEMTPSRSRCQLGIDHFNLFADPCHDTHRWEWIYDLHEVNPTTKKVIGARIGDDSYFIGDAVSLKAQARDEAWVAIICEFLEDDLKKAANFMWFSSDRDIRCKTRKRVDFLENELYITPSWDINPLTAIDGHATIVSLSRYHSRSLSPPEPPSRGGTSKTFICRRGCNTRLATYTEEFVWEELFMPSEEGVTNLINFVQANTKARTCTNLGHQRNTIPPLTQDTLVDSKHVPDYLYTTYENNRKQATFTPLSTTTSTKSDVPSVYQVARARLHASALPTTLPCREHEFQEIYGRLAEAIVDGTGGCIYISGTPGTGKTATVREVIASLEQAVLDDELDDFIFVEVNGMKLTDPYQAYTLLWNALRNQRVSPAQALGLLERELSHPSPRRVPCVVLMDELDQMITKNQGIMYNFFHWPSLRHSKLIVLAVANTMDLPERTLSNKISSRIGLTRITFPGYTHEQLMRIIRARLGGTVGDLIEDDAIQFASRKIAAVSGDARRALDICRRAVEIAETNSHDNHGSSQRVKVSITTVMQAIQEATSDPITSHIRSLALATRVVLFAILISTRRSGITETNVAEVSNVLRECVQISPLIRSRLRYATFGPGSSASDEMPDKHAYVDGLCIKVKVAELCDAGIVAVDSSRIDRPGTIRLLSGFADVSMALGEDEEMTELLSYMRTA